MQFPKGRFRTEKISPYAPHRKLGILCLSSFGRTVRKQSIIPRRPCFSLGNWCWFGRSIADAALERSIPNREDKFIHSASETWRGRRSSGSDSVRSVNWRILGCVPRAVSSVWSGCRLSLGMCEKRWKQSAFPCGMRFEVAVKPSVSPYEEWLAFFTKKIE